MPLSLHQWHVMVWLYEWYNHAAHLVSSSTALAFLTNMSKSNPITGLDRPTGFQDVEAPRFQDSRHMKVVRLSALRTGHLYPPGNIPGTHFCYRLSQPQGHGAARRIMSMKNSNDTIGNRTRDLPTCSTVPQPSAPLRTPLPAWVRNVNLHHLVQSKLKNGKSQYVLTGN